MSAKLSIIIPSYNCEKTIINTINSILNQDFQDFEIMIINDGSTDNTAKVCSDLNNPKIKVFTKKNGRVVSTYMYGISKAESEYIMFCDSDDTFKPNILKKVVTTITDEEADVASFGYDLVSENGKILHRILNGFKDGSFSLDTLESKVLPNFIFNTTIKNCYYTFLVSRCCKIYKTTVLKTILDKLDPKCYQMEDNIFTTLCVLNSKKITVCNESIYNYVTNTNTISKGFNWKLIEEYEYSFSHLKKVISNYKIPNADEQLTYMRFDFYRVIYRRAAKAITYKEIKPLLKTIRDLKITKNLKLKKITALKNKVFYILEKLRMDYLLYLIFRKA